jgi:hypothetical protein
LNYTNANLAALSGNISTLINTALKTFSLILPNQTGSTVVAGNQYILKASRYIDVSTVYSTANSTYKYLNASYSAAANGVDYQFMIFNRSIYD